MSQIWRPPVAISVQCMLKLLLRQALTQKWYKVTRRFNNRETFHSLNLDHVIEIGPVT